MLSLIALESAFGVLDRENLEIVITLVQFLELCSVNLVLQLSDTQVLDLNRVCDWPF